jgi:hypothetical protein
MGKNVQSLLILVVAIVLWSPPAFADKRVALVIGNGAYKNAVHVPNPRNDAQDVAASLTRIGFETIVGVDLDEAGMDEHAIQFARRARDADVANLGRLKAGDVVLRDLRLGPRSLSTRWCASRITPSMIRLTS